MQGMPDFTERFGNKYYAMYLLSVIIPSALITPLTAEEVYEIDSNDDLSPMEKLFKARGQAKLIAIVALLLPIAAKKFRPSLYDYALAIGSGFMTAFLLINVLRANSSPIVNGAIASLLWYGNPRLLAKPLDAIANNVVTPGLTPGMAAKEAKIPQAPSKSLVDARKRLKMVSNNR